MKTATQSLIISASYKWSLCLCICFPYNLYHFKNLLLFPRKIAFYSIRYYSLQLVIFTVQNYSIRAFSKPVINAL